MTKSKRDLKKILLKSPVILFADMGITELFFLLGFCNGITKSGSLIVGLVIS